MKKFFKGLLFLILAIVILIGCGVAYIQINGIPKYETEKIDLKVEVTPERVAMGSKIAAMQCVQCHRGSDNKLSGRVLGEIPTDFGEIHSANITNSKEHGIGKWTDGELYYLLRTGCKPDGQYIPVYMPKFPNMSEDDMQSIIAWLRSDQPEVQASEVATVPSQPSFLVKFLSHVAFKKIPLNKEPIKAPDTSNVAAYGRYLVAGRYDCYPCHSADFKTLNMEFPEKTGGYCGGGNTMLTMEGKPIFTANITVDDETGIGTWTEEDFVKALHEGVNKEGKSLRFPMLRYNNLTNQEVKAIFTYLRTVPVIKNKVDRQWDKDL
jgi:mono/diheme cytochrome c family protein